ncbi:hypothetical protein [Streptomyces sp. G-5]|uniref:hypothetical protein n=1 Tax=Streptomyces sp. G-5 TaxID=2977231 RepID=UPI0021CF0ECA|nr:hypothetical protein [Streptomyces sp. G-5]MCU4749460.1 hypothetical protein [Streptomyces sp. G-5]
MDRRSVPGASIAAVPLTVLTTLDEAIDVPPAPRAAPIPAHTVAEYRRVGPLFDAGDHLRLMQSLPDLLANAQAFADRVGAADARNRLGLTPPS